MIFHDKPLTIIKNAFKSQLASNYGFTAHITRIVVAVSVPDAPNGSKSSGQGSSTVLLKQIVAHCWNVGDIALSSASLSTLVELSHVCGPALVNLGIDEVLAYESRADEAMVLLRFPSLRQLRIGTQYSVARTRQIDGWSTVRCDLPSLVELELLMRNSSAIPINRMLPALVRGKCVATVRLRSRLVLTRKP